MSGDEDDGDDKGQRSRAEQPGPKSTNAGFAVRGYVIPTVIGRPLQQSDFLMTDGPLCNICLMSSDRFGERKKKLDPGISALETFRNVQMSISVNWVPVPGVHDKCRGHG